MSDRSHLSRRAQVLAAVSSFSCLACLMIVALLCMLLGLIGILIVNAVEEFEPITLLEKRVPIASSNLPENLEVRGWHAVATNVLDKNGWNLPLNLVLFSTYVPCTSLSDASRVRMEFVAIDGSPVLPHKIAAVVSFDRERGDASVWVYDAGPKLRHAPIMHLSSLKVGLIEAFDKAERLGGQEFRAGSNNECDIVVWLHDYEWNIDYRNLLSTQSGLRVRVDAISGTTSLDR
jgi:hypothetical protein